MNNLWKPWTLTNIVFFVQKVDPEIVFTKQERIGKGSFGEVFKGIDNRTQQVKIFQNFIFLLIVVIPKLPDNI